jgi:hypothetical protein
MKNIELPTICFEMGIFKYGLLQKLLWLPAFAINEASERLNNYSTVKKVQWTFDSEAENLAKRSAVTDNQHLACVSVRRDLAYVPIADKH